MSGGGEGFGPIWWRHRSLNEDGANDVVGCANGTLRFAILWRCVRTGKAKGSPKGSEICTVGDVVELFAVVALDGSNGAVEMGSDEGVKVGESGVNVGFKMHRKAPHEMGKIINDNQIILATGNTGYRGTP